MTLYDQLGGAPAIAAAVDDFYVRVLADPVLAHHFAGVPMSRLSGHQRDFLTAALGGPDVYRGPDLAEAHAALGLVDDDFDRVLRHLVDTLTALGVDAALIAEAGGALEPLRRVVAPS